MTAKAVPTIQIENDRVYALPNGASPKGRPRASIVTSMITWSCLANHRQGSRSSDPMAARASPSLPAGQAYAREAGVEHDVINAHDGEFVFVEIELKSPELAADRRRQKTISSVRLRMQP